MFARRFTVLTLSALTLTTLPACDDTLEAEATMFRAVTLTDKWGVHEPAEFPEINSCYDYWNTRCSELSSAQCAYLQARYTCSESMQGVLITDRFGGQISELEGVWRVHTRGQDGFSAPAASALAACGKLNDKKMGLCCASLAEIAEQVPELLELAPQGGLAPVLPVDEIDDSVPMFDGDLALELLEPLDWAVPPLPHEARMQLGEAVVIRDDIMLIVAPDGTTSISTKDVVLIRDVRCTMDKVEVCVDVDVK